MNEIHFGVRLKALREEQGMTLAELSERSKVPLQSIARLERGERVPGWKTVLAVSDGLGVTPNDFLEPPASSEPQPRGWLKSTPVEEQASGKDAAAAEDRRSGNGGAKKELIEMSDDPVLACPSTS